MPIGETWVSIIPPMSMFFKKVGPAAWTIACIGKFDQISTCDSFIYFIIYFTVNCLLRTVFILNTIE